MARLTKLDRLPTDIKTALAEKVLSTLESYEDIGQWLLARYGIKTSKSSIGRFAMAIRSHYSGLIELGVSPVTLAGNVGKLEKLGAYLVQRELLNRRIEALQNTIFNAPALAEGDV